MSMNKSPEEYFQEQNFTPAPQKQGVMFSDAELAFMRKYMGLETVDTLRKIGIETRPAREERPMPVYLAEPAVAGASGAATPASPAETAKGVLDDFSQALTKALTQAVKTEKTMAPSSAAQAQAAAPAPQPPVSRPAVAQTPGDVKSLLDNFAGALARTAPVDAPVVPEPPKVPVVPVVPVPPLSAPAPVLPAPAVPVVLAPVVPPKAPAPPLVPPAPAPQPAISRPAVAQASGDVKNLLDKFAGALTRTAPAPAPSAPAVPVVSAPVVSPKAPEPAPSPVPPVAAPAPESVTLAPEPSAPAVPVVSAPVVPPKAPEPAPSPVPPVAAPAPESVTPAPEPSAPAVPVVSAPVVPPKAPAPAPSPAPPVAAPAPVPPAPTVPVVSAPAPKPSAPTDDLAGMQVLNEQTLDLHEEMAVEKDLESIMRSESELQMVGFYLGSQEFTVPTIAVQEVIRYQIPAKLPASPEFVAGVINLRGRMTPLVYLRDMLEVNQERKSEDRFIIVCRRKGLQFGLLIERVHTMYRVPQRDIDWGIEAHLGINVELISGLLKLGESLVPVVSADRIVDYVLEKGDNG
ncbi:MAG: chemotaxis protein CheW [Desulfovibrionaceae bacterium]|nr:chemotaxis protein CheW [Desulfovibrionaceae bacterium]